MDWLAQLFVRFLVALGMSRADAERLVSKLLGRKRSRLRDLPRSLRLSDQAKTWLLAPLTPDVDRTAVVAMLLLIAFNPLGDFSQPAKADDPGGARVAFVLERRVYYAISPDRSQVQVALIV